MYHLEGFARIQAGLDRARLGDRRRNRRARRLVASMIAAPSQSLSRSLGDRHQAKRSYAFLGSPLVEPEATREGILVEVAADLATRSRALVLGDDTCLDCTTRPATRGLGPIGDHRGRGLQVHGLLAVDADDGRVLGLADVQIWARPERARSRRAEGESTHARAGRARESEVWLRGVARVAARVAAARDPLTAAGPAPRLISVGDCGADIFRHLHGVAALGHGFLCRAYQDRALCAEDGEPLAEHLHAAARRGAARGTRTTTVRDARGRQRSATLTVVATTVWLRPPGTMPPGTPPLRTNVVWCHEPAPPAGQEAAEWMLLTSEPVETREQVAWALWAYERRWLIEEWHMALKTGLRVEDRQFESRHALENFLSLAAPVATCLLQLRDEARRPDARAAAIVLPEEEWTALRALRPRLRADASTADALREVGRLGGHAGSNQTRAGWRTLWRGMETLWQVANGVRIARNPDLTPPPKGSGER
jgi:hypothetical protein